MFCMCNPRLHALLHVTPFDLPIMELPLQSAQSPPEADQPGSQQTAVVRENSPPQKAQTLRCLVHAALTGMQRQTESEQEFLNRTPRLSEKYSGFIQNLKGEVVGAVYRDGGL